MAVSSINGRGRLLALVRAGWIEVGERESDIPDILEFDNGDPSGIRILRSTIKASMRNTRSDYTKKQLTSIV